MKLPMHKVATFTFLSTLVAAQFVVASNKVKVQLNSGTVDQYNTENVESIDFLKGNNFQIKFNDGSETVDYKGDAAQISFMKQNEPVKGGVEITTADGWFESAYAEWKPVEGAAGYNVYCKQQDGSYNKIDKELVRKSGSLYRADALGLPKGDYILKIVPTDAAGKELAVLATETDVIAVSAFDRSGYAHFNYTEGVGAYNDNGTLKKDAIVIYVTEENKDKVVVPGYEKMGTGIGWLLNNAQYSSSTSNTYSPNASSLGIFPITKEHPVCIRFIGKITSPEGLTAYNSTDNGGTVGDNGHLARMKDARNLTLEGVGNDAQIYGWGFHFMASDASDQYGKNFEARNLLFDDYPEDAIGMEGTQASSTVTSDLTASVEHCWVHHCSFKQGYCENPAESDKKEGDGSCDFKRGQYFTLSYCYFEYGHKTNLIGSSDASLQFNISFHHNMWKCCASRIPLLRNANLHFYNNYVYGDMTDPEAALSYVASCRANSYRFSENNFFDGCKNVCELTSGGVSKSYGDIYYACFGANDATMASSRTQAANSNCQFQARKLNFANFDTDSKLFYYNAAKQQTDAYITDAVTARKDVLKYAGVQKQQKVTNTSMNLNPVSGSIDMSRCSFFAAIGTSQAGITFTNVNKTSGKFKGQGITFRIDRACKVTLEAGSDAFGGPYLMAADGTLIGQVDGNKSFNIGAGTYFIGSGSKDKESAITAMSLSCIDESEVDKKVDSESGDPNGGESNGENVGGNGENSGNDNTVVNPDLDLTADQMLTFDKGVTDPSGFFTINANLKSGVAAKTVNGLTFTSAIKMETATAVSFNTAAQKTLYIITDTPAGKVNVDGTSIATDADGIANVKLNAGSHEITKGTSLNVYAILLK